MLIETSISFYDGTILVKLGSDVKDLEENRKGVYAFSEYLSDNALINLAPKVKSFALDKFSSYKEGEISEHYSSFQLQDPSNLRWTEEQKQILRTAEEYVSRNRSSIKNYKNKEMKKEKRRRRSMKDKE